jgi:hypothetical protein
MMRPIAKCVLFITLAAALLPLFAQSVQAYYPGYGGYVSYPYAGGTYWGGMPISSPGYNYYGYSYGWSGWHYNRLYYSYHRPYYYAPAYNYYYRPYLYPVPSYGYYSYHPYMPYW